MFLDRKRYLEKKTLFLVITGVLAMSFFGATQMEDASMKKTTSTTFFQSESSLLFVDTFDLPNGLITNEYAEDHPDDPQSVHSDSWEMTSGSVFAQNKSAWTGIPDSCAPSSDSSICTNSNVFRLRTKQTFAGNIKVSLALRQNVDIHTEDKNKAWYGTHIWLRYQNPYNLYSVSVNRADGQVVLKRKVPCGFSNEGTYFVLGEYTPHDWTVGTWNHYSVSIKSNGDGSVTLELYDDDQELNMPVVVGIDSGGENPNWSPDCTTEGRYPTAHYEPITAAGRVGVRGDYANFTFDDFIVTTLQHRLYLPMVAGGNQNE